MCGFVTGHLSREYAKAASNLPDVSPASTNVKQSWLEHGSLGFFVENGQNAKPVPPHRVLLFTRKTQAFFYCGIQSHLSEFFNELIFQ